MKGYPCILAIIHLRGNFNPPMRAKKSFLVLGNRIRKMFLTPFTLGTLDYPLSLYRNCLWTDQDAMFEKSCGHKERTVVEQMGLKESGKLHKVPLLNWVLITLMRKFIIRQFTTPGCKFLPKLSACLKIRLWSYTLTRMERDRCELFRFLCKSAMKIDIIQVNLLELFTPHKHKERFCLGMGSRAAQYQYFLINSIFIILFLSLSITILVILKRALIN